MTLATPRANLWNLFRVVSMVLIALLLLSGRPVTEISLAQSLSPINEMGNMCTAEIGKIEAFSCLSGEIIPVTVNGVVPPSGTAVDECDHPSFLAPAYCNLYSRVGRLPSLDKDGNPDPDVQNAFICRRYNNVTDPNNPDFYDVAIIQHRKSTGNTCFFQHLGSYTNATRVPPPAEVPSQTPVGHPTADSFWLEPARTAGIGCNNCHDMGPFIRSPYINQVKLSGTNEPVIFPLPDLAMGQQQNYRFLGDAFRFWGVPESIAPSGNRCAFCHVFGTKSSSSNYTQYSTGRARPTHITDRFAAYPDSHWMPPDQAHEMPEHVWNSMYEAAVNEILACNHANTMLPDAGNCNRKPFGP